ncbi:MAG: TonB-dependent receptor [Bacteroidales bacterium]|nr:TonB-dependent receptor [Bacteroidales bacterium]
MRHKTYILLRYLLMLLFHYPFLMLYAQSYTISGYITDKETHETLIGATIQIKDENKATRTDGNGFFSITGIKNGEYTLSISHIGYRPEEIKLNVENKGVVLKEIVLVPVPLPIEEVSIMAIRSDETGDRTIETSLIELTPKMIHSIPTAGKDVFSAVKYLPGIDRTEPFSPLYTVRGGDPGENAVMLDGVMIYNPYHSSITSGIFNTLTIKNVDLLVGGFGAEYGGRNSSVMYITTIDGNPEELHGEIEPSTFYSKLFLEFPAGKNASMMIAGRYLYDIATNFIFQDQNYFYDYNLSYTNRINERNRLTLKYFESKDYTGFNLKTFYRYFGNTFNTDIYENFELQQQNDWRNRAATLIHKLILSPRIFLRTQAYYSSHRSKNFSGLDFRLDVPQEQDDTLRLQWRSDNKLGSEITDMGFKSAVSIKILNINELRAGIEYNAYIFRNHITINDIDNGSFTRYPSIWAAFIEDRITTGIFSLRPGIRFTYYNQLKWLCEPRINVTLQLPGHIRFKLAYGQYLQYIISMNSNEIEMSQIVDYYYPLWDKEPSKSVHYIAGIEKRVSPSLNVSIDGYYKEMPRVYAFDMNNYFGFSERIQQGKGNAYGVELLVNGHIGKVSGWLSYSYARATRQFPGSQINQGRAYDFDYTRPHTFKTVLTYQMTSNFALNISLVYLSGTKRSVENTQQSYYYYDPVNNETAFFPMYTTNEKNSARMPPLINLDLGIKKQLLSGFGKQLSDFFRADESYTSITIRNILFLYRNVEFFIPGTGIPGYEDKYIPLGSNYIPSVGLSYTIKF